MTYKDILRAMHEEKGMNLPDIRRLELLSKHAKLAAEDKENNESERLLAKAVQTAADNTSSHLMQEFVAFIEMQFQNMRNYESSINPEIQPK